MTIPNTVNVVQVVGPQASPLSLPFLVVQAADVVVYLQSAAGVAPVKLALTTDYTVGLLNQLAGAQLVFVSSGAIGTSLASGAILTIGRDPAEVQTTAFQAQGPFPAPAVQSALDLLTMEVQATRTHANNAIKIPLAESLAGLTTVLPTATVRANRWLAFDSSGNATVVSGSGPVLPSSIFSAKTYGAVPGQDSTAAIQAAATAASNANGVLLIEASPSAYLLSGMITIGSNTTILGYGATLQRKTGSPQHGLYFNGAANVTIKGLTLDGNQSENVASYFADTYTYFCGVVADACSNIVFEDCTVNGAIRGGMQFRTTSSNTIKITACTFTNNGKYPLSQTVNGVQSSLADAIDSLGATDVQITNNRFYNSMHAHMAMLSWSIGPVYGARVVIANNICDTTINSTDKNGSSSGDASITVWQTNDVVISGNFVKNTNAGAGCYGYGIRFEQASNCSITGNHVITSVTAAGIQVYNGANNVTVSGNQLDSNYRGIEINGATNLTVSGNSISNSTQYGIISQGAYESMSIVGNVVTANGSDGIIVTDLGNNVTNDIILSGNIVQGNVGAGIHFYPAGTKTSTYYNRIDMAGNITSGNCTSAGGSEVNINRGVDVAIANPIINVTGAGADTGIYTDTNCLNTSVIGGQIFGAHATYAFQHLGTAFRIFDTDCSGATGYIATGTAFTTRDCANPGTTKLRTTGTGTITSAATSVAITHGLSTTPDFSQIRIIPSASIGTGLNWYIASASSTTFTVELGAAPGSNFTFEWVAELTPVA